MVNPGLHNCPSLEPSSVAGNPAGSVLTGREKRDMIKAGGNLCASSGAAFFPGLVFAIAGTFCLSTSYITVKVGLRGFNVTTFTLIWTVAAALFSLGIVLSTGSIQRIRPPAGTPWRLLGLGATTGASMIWSWAGLARLDPSTAAFLWRFLPLINIVVAMLLFQDRIRRCEALPISLMLFGGCLSVYGQGRFVLIGALFTLLACMAVSAQQVISKTLVARMPTPVLVFYRNGIGALFILIWVLTGGELRLDASPAQWGVTLLGALLAPCLGFILLYRSFHYWELSRASIIQIAEPVFVVPMACLILDDRPSGRTFAGGAIILAGALWLILIHMHRQSGRAAVEAIRNLRAPL